MQFYKLRKWKSALQSIVDSKLDKLKNEFVQGINKKFKPMKSNINLELSIY